MKEINTNNQLRIVYSFNDKRKPKDNLTLLSGIMTEIKITKKMTLDLNLQSYFFKTNFRYKEEIIDTYTEEKSTREFDYDKFIGTTSIGIGIGYKI